MKRSWTAVTAILMIAAAVAVAQNDDAPADAGKKATAPAKQIELKTTKQQASYAIGQNIGNEFKANQLDLDLAALFAGISDVLNNRETRLAPEQAQQALTAFQQQMRAKLDASQKAAGEKNKAAGKAFLAANKKKEGVVTLESGLQYKIVEKGDGPSPSAQDTVKVHYHGTLIDGTVFDSSVDRKQPVEFPVNGVIRGWVEALQLMKVGGKWKLFIPSELAYGPRSPAEVIGPHSVLVFDVELLEIK